jgi:hypothetical protein
MANFDEHLFWGFCGGTIFAVAGLQTQYIKRPEDLAIVILSILGASIPDIDHNKIKKKDPQNPENTIELESKPFRHFTIFISFVLSILGFQYFGKYLNDDVMTVPGMSIFLFAILIFFTHTLVRFVIKQITIHRGIMHSIPFAILCGELTYLIFTNVDIYSFFTSVSPSKHLPFFFGAAVFVGFLTHLIADEIHSLKWDKERKKMSKTSYFGTALTMYSRKNSTVRANLALYVMVAILFAVIKDQKMLLTMFRDYLNQILPG